LGAELGDPDLLIRKSKAALALLHGRKPVVGDGRRASRHLHSSVGPYRDRWTFYSHAVANLQGEAAAKLDGALGASIGKAVKKKETPLPDAMRPRCDQAVSRAVRSKYHTRAQTLTQ
jgi:hypothetical protein